MTTGQAWNDLSENGGHEYRAIRRVTSYGLDLGGMAAVGTPWPGFRLGNLDLSFPCDQWRTILERAETAKWRTFANRAEYKKIHGAWHVLTLAPRQVDALIARLYDGLADAEETARVFYAEHGTIAERLAGSRHVVLAGSTRGNEYKAPARGEA